MTNDMILEAVKKFEVEHKYELARAQIEIFAGTEHDTVVLEVRPFPAQDGSTKPEDSARAAMPLREMQAASMEVDEDIEVPEGTPARGPNLEEQVFETLDELCSQVSGTKWGPDAVPRRKKKGRVQGHDPKSPGGLQQGSADKGKSGGPEAGHPGKHEGEHRAKG